MCSILFSELRRREVINICTGCRLGYICDIELDINCGKLLAFIVPEREKLFSFKRRQEFRIPFDCINKISDDFILVTNAYPIHCDSDHVD